MRIFLFILAITCVSHLAAQLTVETKIGQNPGSMTDGDILPAPNGGYVISGTSAYAQPTIIRTDNSGNILWQKDYILPGGTVTSTILQSDSGYYLVGLVLDSTSEFNYYVLHTDTAGVLLWVRQYITDSTLQIFSGGYGFPGGNAYGSDRRVKADIMSDGSIVFLGYAMDLWSVNFYVQVHHIDVNGNLTWTKQITSTKVKGYDVEIKTSPTKQESDKIYVIADDQYGTILTEFDESGNEVWSRKYNSSNYMRGTRLQLTTDNALIIAGRCQGSQTLEVFAIKVDTAGTLIWSKTFSSGNDEWILGSAALPQGEFILCGGHTPLWGTCTAALWKIDASGTVQWSQSYSDPIDDESDFESVIVCADSGYACLGMSGSQLLDYKFYLVKTDPGGSGVCNDSANSISVQPFVVNITTPPGATITNPVQVNLSASTVQGTALSDSLCITTASNHIEQEQPQLHVYPNPSTGHVQITGLSSQCKIVIFSPTGAIVFVGVVSPQTPFLELTTINAGNYIIRLESEHGFVYRKLVLMQ